MVPRCFTSPPSAIAIDAPSSLDAALSRIREKYRAQSMRALATWRARSQDRGGLHFASAPQKDRDAVCAPQAHSQTRPFTVTRPKWRARRVHSRGHCPKPSQDGQADPDAHVKADLENPQGHSAASTLAPLQ